MLDLLAMRGRHELVELVTLESSFQLDIRYARSDNFLGYPVYSIGKAFLQKTAASDLVKAHQELQKQGVGILVFDGYRPWSVTKIFWEKSNESQRRFLANPEKGSIHNRGSAIDCSLFDLATKKEIEMPSQFDEMNEKAASKYQGGSIESRRWRDLLIATMEKHHFNVIENEWWHFNHHLAREYPLLDFSFEELMQD